jgi:phosphoenolpyruvate phosphomutase
MIIENPVSATDRIRALREIIDRKGFARILEAHNGLSAIIAENVRVEKDGQTLEYDGIWESSLTDSASKGLPDASIVGCDSRIHTIDEILNVTSKPIVVDGDTGGEPAQFEYLVRHLERLGVSAVIIEDKVYPKRNSLDASANQDLEDPERFAEKIQAGKEVAFSSDFMVISRLESLIAGAGMADALDRAEQYILAGTDGIMIHSSKSDPREILEFADAYTGLCQRLRRRPILVSVPTTYNSLSDAELVDRGFNLIIHANHMLRSAYKAMSEVASVILAGGSSLDADPLCATVSEVFATVGFDRITRKDRERDAARRILNGKQNGAPIGSGSRL